MRELTQQHHRNPLRVDFSTQPVRSLSIILRASLPATDVHSCLQVIMAALEAAAIAVNSSSGPGTPEPGKKGRRGSFLRGGGKPSGAAQAERAKKKLAQTARGVAAAHHRPAHGDEAQI